MGKVRRKHVVVVLCLVIGLLMLDQLYLHYTLSMPSAPFALSLFLDDVRNMFRASEDAGVTAVLFDPVIMQAYHQHSHLVSNPTVCVFLCHVVGPLVFAVSYHEIKDKPLFVNRLVELGFTVTQFTSKDGLQTHISMIRYGSPLHIILLHWNDAGYFRQYGVVGTTHQLAKLKQYITKDTWKILSSDRAYKSFSTQAVDMDGVRVVLPADVLGFVEAHATARFLPCNETRAQHFKLKNPPRRDGGAEADQRFVHKAWKALSTTRAVLDHLEVPFWLSSGTALGFYRQCEIFPWAQDVDVGVFIDDLHPGIVEEMVRRGMTHKHTFGRPSDSYELSFVLNDVKVDIFFFYREGATIWNGACNTKGEKFKYLFPFFTLCWTEFLGLLVRIPCNTEEYIVANYGPNWMTPIKSWSYIHSPPNAIPNGRWPVEEWPEVMQTHTS